MKLLLPDAAHMIITLCIQQLETDMWFEGIRLLDQSMLKKKNLEFKMTHQTR